MNVLLCYVANPQHVSGAQKPEQIPGGWGVKSRSNPQGWGCQIKANPLGESTDGGAGADLITALTYVNFLDIMNQNLSGLGA